MHRRLHSRPGRRPAQGHRQEDQGQDGPAGAQVPGGRGGHRHGARRSSTHLWSLMEKAGDYSFNKSHAACYALISYRTAYLKANYPVQYMAALISSVMDTKDKVPFYVNVANEMGIEVLPPDINESVLDFRGVEGRIRFGLNAVKNVGETAIRNILDARERGRPVHRPVRLLRAGGPGHRQPAGRSRACSSRGPWTPSDRRGGACCRCCRRPWRTARRCRPTPTRARAPSSICSPSAEPAPARAAAATAPAARVERRVRPWRSPPRTSARKSFWRWRRRLWAST